MFYQTQLTTGLFTVAPYAFIHHLMSPDVRNKNKNKKKIELF